MPSVVISYSIPGKAIVVGDGRGDFKSHIRTTPSESRFNRPPFCVKAIALIGPFCPSRTRGWTPVPEPDEDRSHTLAAPSAPPLTNRPSGRNTREFTLPPCPRSTIGRSFGSAAFRSHTLTVPSVPPLTRRPSGAI